MKKAAIAFLVLFCQLNAKAQQIIIHTAHTALVYKVSTEKHLLQTYLGDILADSSDYSKIPNIPVDAYITGGMSLVREPALQVTHADGNPSLQLLYTSYGQQTVDANTTITHILLKDPVYPFTVTLYITTNILTRMN